jgi:hypothetical protein
MSFSASREERSVDDGSSDESGGAEWGIDGVPISPPSRTAPGSVLLGEQGGVQAQSLSLGQEPQTLVFLDFGNIRLDATDATKEMYRSHILFVIRSRHIFMRASSTARE